MQLAHSLRDAEYSILLRANYTTFLTIPCPSLLTHALPTGLHVT